MSKLTLFGRVVIVSTFFLSLNAYARGVPGLLGLDIEPVVGYERAQMLIPTKHTKDRLIYGARASAGFLFLAGEAEYLRGTSTEAFPDLALSTKDISDIAKLGLRAQLHLIGFISLVARAGAQAKKNHHEQTTAGVMITNDDPVVIHPYGGAGLEIRLGSNFAFSAEVVAVFLDSNNLSYNEYQATAGFTVHLP